MAAIEGLHLVGGNVALDFANTVGSHSSDHPHDHVDSYGDLLTWCARSGVLTAEQERALRKRAGSDPAGAARALEKAGRLRESIYRLFMAVAGGAPVPGGEPALRADLGEFNGFAEESFSHVRVTYTGGAFGLGFDPAGRLDGMLAVIAWNAIELLRGPEVGRVKACGNGTCGWLFVDRSKNRSRRWCEMSDCGNNEKARRFVARRKGQPAGERKPVGLRERASESRSRETRPAAPEVPVEED